MVDAEVILQVARTSAAYKSLGLLGYEIYTDLFGRNLLCIGNKLFDLRYR